MKDWREKILEQDCGTILIDNTEKDIILIWSEEKNESNVLIIKRENIDKVIKKLNQCKQRKRIFI